MKNDRKIRVLIVDDQQNIRELVSALVESVVPDVMITSCPDLDSAIYIVKGSTSEPFNLVITDFNIPDGNEGFEIATLTKKLSPDTKIIVMSGNMWAVNESKCPGHRFIEKPFTVAEMLTAITNLLELNASQPAVA